MWPHENICLFWIIDLFIDLVSQHARTSCPKYDTTKVMVVKIGFKNHGILVIVSISITQGLYHRKNWK